MPNKSVKEDRRIVDAVSDALDERRRHEENISWTMRQLRGIKDNKTYVSVDAVLDDIAEVLKGLANGGYKF